MATSGLIRDGRPVGKWRASFLLAKETFRFLRDDKEILLVPIVIGALEIVALLALGLVVFAAGVSVPEASDTISDGALLATFAAYVISAFAIAYSQGAITHIVYTRAHGGNASLGDGLSAAGSVAGALFAWSLVTSTVGIIVRVMSERSQLLGKIVAGLIGAAWSILTYFAVPAMVIDKKQPLAAIKHSSAVFRKTWGESLITNFGLGLFFLLVLFSIAALSVGMFALVFTTESPISLLFVPVIVTVILLIIFMLVTSALNAILKVLLYIYASEGTVPPNFDAELLGAVVARQPSQVSSGPALSTV